MAYVSVKILNLVTMIFYDFDIFEDFLYFKTSRNRFYVKLFLMSVWCKAKIVFCFISQLIIANPSEVVEIMGMFG